MSHAPCRHFYYTQRTLISPFGQHCVGRCVNDAFWGFFASLVAFHCSLHTLYVGPFDRTSHFTLQRSGVCRTNSNLFLNQLTTQLQHKKPTTAAPTTTFPIRRIA